MRRIWLAFVVAACHQSTPATTDSAASDAGPACDPSAPFGAPIDHPELAGATSVRLTGDQLTAVYSSRGANLIAERANRDVPFGAGKPVLGGVFASVSPDGLRLLWTDGANIWSSGRASRGDDFQAPTSTSYLDVPTSSIYIVDNDVAYVFGKSASSLYPSLYRATLDTNGTPGPLTIEWSPSSTTYDPVVTRDETSVFVCVPMGSVASNGCGIAATGRASVADAWGDLAPFDGLIGNGPLLGEAFHTPMWVSGDGCTFYYTQEAQNNVITVEEIRRGQ